MVSPFPVKIHIVPLLCSSIYPSRLFLCELLAFGGVSHVDVCLSTDIMEPDGMWC